MEVGDEESNSSDSESNNETQVTEAKSKKAPEERTPLSVEGEEKNVISWNNTIGEGEDITSEEESEEDGNGPESSEEESSSEEDIITTKDNHESLSAVKNKMNDEDNDDKSGWADAMAKVLNMGKNTAQTDPNKPLFLSKAIKDNDAKQRSTVSSKDNDTGDNEKDKVIASKAPIIRASIRRAQKKELEEKGRCKPDIVKDRAKEKLLCKLATKGIVQLFNAVREQQKSIKTQINTVGGSVRKREKVYKNIDRQSFLNVLTNQTSLTEDHATISDKALKQKSTMSSNAHSQKRPKIETFNEEIKPEIFGDDDVKQEISDADDDGGGNEGTWNVFRDDFMMGAKMKDWDKEDSESDG